MSNWARPSMFMDGRFLNVARIGFMIIINELGKRNKFLKTEKCKKLEINDQFLNKKKKVCNVNH
jgi:hypothetical protein